jgi:hypothetical protein
MIDALLGFIALLLGAIEYMAEATLVWWVGVGFIAATVVLILVAGYRRDQR